MSMPAQGIMEHQPNRERTMRTVELTDAEMRRLIQAIDTQILDLTGSGASTPRALLSALKKLEDASGRKARV